MDTAFVEAEGKRSPRDGSPWAQAPHDKPCDKIRVAREWRRQGYPGSRPVAAAAQDVPVRRVRQIVQALKVRQKKRAERHHARVRVRLSVKKPNVLLTMDGASPALGDFIVSRDRADLGVAATKCKGHLNSADTINELNKFKSTDRLPLVLGTDNGSPFCARIIEDYLHANRVIHLRSLPRVPEHNGSCESAVKDFKQLIVEHRLAPREACRRLNEYRLRASLHYQTPAQYRAMNETVFSEKERNDVYEAATLTIRESVRGTKTVYESRKAEREAIFQTLERFGLITRTRGRTPPAVKPEEIT